MAIVANTPQNNEVFFRSSLLMNGNMDSVDCSEIIDNCNDDVHMSHQEQVALSMPPAHHQLFFQGSSNIVEYESLKGYDHSRADGYYFDDSGHTNTTSQTSSSCCRSSEKVSAVKKRGGGSWLLGFARLRNDDQEEEEATPPALVRSNSHSSFSSEESDSLSSSTHSTSTTSSSYTPKKKGVSFNNSVSIHAIPHSSTLSNSQRRKMYSSSLEVRQNKIRNKKEYRYDLYDWRNSCEEWEMSVCMVTGDLIHPAHTI
ncbi:hypothetical protein THAPSDRAFT_25463 [Thalassiosira pseudonana CCMP1335]|jgi:hypothetical protein|uniref:Uncharacterized protein n=1 Tax=Thalassiosira pseudonana TaxID=35128 RepID=B8LD46_THAPS|nr:hypothetical protein THAPSDRAFT_25463 [Thalassiosira pseudonana CCMP1335]EED86746.1 hypothetical protein THAPSDRAFT_25463 [Thalassiosira pseudonana CCMP1335]|eukprot:g13803.t1 g13803   contig9:482279-483049(-)